MLKNRKGNLLCFQWEVERFQQSHREKMATVAPQTVNKPTQQLRRRRGLLRKTARDQLAEIDVKRQNAFLLEKMANVHHTGGFQRRSLHEFQDVKAALQFGKANVAISRAAHEHRFTARKKQQERVRRENAQLFARLASPNRSGIDFNKFEADFAKSRARYRLVQCNRTVGHTSVFSVVQDRAPCFGADATPGEPPPPRLQPSEGVANVGASLGPGRAVQGQRTHARRIRSKQHSPAARVPSRRPPCAREAPAVDGTSTRNKKAGPAVVFMEAGKKSGEAARPRRPQTAGGRRRRPIFDRPHTALGLRRGGDNRDLLDARAADPGWSGGTRASLAERSFSTSDGVDWGSWDNIGTHSRRPGSLPLNSTDDGLATRRSRPMKSRREPRALFGASKGEQSFEGDSDEAFGFAAQGGPWFLGRTLLAEAKVLIYGNSKSNARRRTKMRLKCLSLDGLVRQGGRVRKTLRGFAVEASPAQPPYVAEGRGTGSRSGAAAVTVPVVLEFLETLTSRRESPLAPFREVCPLDDQGNYPELGAVLGLMGQRDLYQTLLGSCRVVVGDGGIGVELLQEMDGGLGICATIVTPDTAHDLESPNPGRPETTTEQDIPTTGSTRDKVDQEVNSRGMAGLGSRSSEGITAHCKTAPADGRPGDVPTAKQEASKSSIAVPMPPASSAVQRAVVIEGDSGSADEQKGSEDEEGASEDEDEYEEDESD